MCGWLCAFMYVCMCVRVCVHVYMYVCMYDRHRQTDRQVYLTMVVSEDTKIK